jgi:PEP-CTERM motif
MNPLSLVLRRFCRLQFPSLLAAMVALVPVASQSTTINWGTYIGPTTYLFDSTGTALNDSYYFQLGSFGNSFTPTDANLVNWWANWKPFDQAEAPPSSGWNSSTGVVARTATLETDMTTSNTALSQTNFFTAGEQAYIWVFKDLTALGVPTFTTGFEWALVTNNSSDGNVADDWLFPTPSGHVASTLDWRIEDATASPFGGLNNIQGPGDYSSTPSDFILQTHTATVPEPGSALLIGLSGLFYAVRLRRRRMMVL